MTAFLKAHGTGDAPLPDHWMTAGSRLLAPGRTGFPRRPRMQPGDRLVLYASRWKCIFGVAEVAGEPEADAGVSLRWPWSVTVELLVVVPVLSNAPPVEAIGVAPRSMRQQSHIRLEQRHFELALEALASVGR
ncbi:MAG: EVE domain-containing protein [Actinomycetota bacterium]|nr:EVE domain-containing protein [Actinomycetota bacterium]